MSALRRQRGGGDGEADRVSVAALALGDEVQVGACVRGWSGLAATAHARTGAHARAGPFAAQSGQSLDY